MSIFERLVGLETEYAMRLEGGQPSARPSRFRVFQSLVRAVGRRVLAVDARHHKDGVFLANGGALWFDGDRPCRGGGVIEGATPECRGPRQLLHHQRAQDRLLREASKAAPERFALLKNDRDHLGNVYGGQENYQCEIASGWRLLLWRIGILAMLPLVLTWAISLATILAALMLYMLTASAFCWLTGLSGSRFSRVLLGSDWADGSANGQPAPPWLESATLWLTRIFTAPIALAVLALAHAVAFRRVRRELTTLLVSRCVLSGVGMVNSDGSFSLADKAPSINCLLGIGRFGKERPIYAIANFYKTLYAELFTSPGDYLALFAKRQRLQISLGDSNLAETAEYLKIATTLLVIDAIEAGVCRDAPRLRSPLTALRMFCNDPTLRARVRCRDGREYTALELQRKYLSICRRFVLGHDNAPPEARETLRLWGQTLDALERYQGVADTPRELLGAVDWVTKRWLLGNAAPTGWNAAKKVDLRYAELSPDGYFATLEAAGMAHRITSESEVERAMRLPPPCSPATTRGHYIREFSGGPGSLRVNWRSVTIGDGRSARRVRISDPGSRPTNLDDPQTREVPGR